MCATLQRKFYAPERKTVRVWYASLVAWNGPLGRNSRKLKGRCISAEKVDSNFIIGVVGVVGVVGVIGVIGVIGVTGMIVVIVVLL
ncbi:hypothetical protein BHYA_0118g00310 [Botrytis hyacinthi]|uniref:Uncharacterized protein n=1 Tax=Botrytis hyacinthi TaxID=278943 RepID=A0A4Z1GIH1_9HELO|nr:hypothetical protein BHYA_0118g00310 [Botrytis hyacinthi]